MRIYETATEYSSGKDRCVINDRFRIVCETFEEALKDAQRRINGKNVMIQSIEIVADTEL